MGKDGLAIKDYVVGQIVEAEPLTKKELKKENQNEKKESES